MINFTNHSYFNLAGEDSFAGSAYGQFVQINANSYPPTDTTQIPHRRGGAGRGHAVRLHARRTPSAPGSTT